MKDIMLYALILITAFVICPSTVKLKYSSGLAKNINGIRHSNTLHFGNLKAFLNRLCPAMFDSELV